MVHLEGESSNALFDILEDWNKHLKAENFELPSQNPDKSTKAKITPLKMRGPATVNDFSNLAENTAFSSVVKLLIIRPLVAYRRL